RVEGRRFRPISSWRHPGPSALAESTGSHASGRGHSSRGPARLSPGCDQGNHLEETRDDHGGGRARPAPGRRDGRRPAAQPGKGHRCGDGAGRGPGQQESEDHRPGRSGGPRRSNHGTVFHYLTRGARGAGADGRCDSHARFAQERGRLISRARGRSERRGAMPVTEGVKQTGPIAAGWEAGHPNVNLPNLLTLSRILLIPVFVLLFWTPTPGRSLAAAVVFVIAAVTDLLDGYLARRRSQVTKLGRLLDPIADKLLVLSGLSLVVQLQRVAAVVAILIIAREVAVTGVRAIAASQGIVL